MYRRTAEKNYRQVNTGSCVHAEKEFQAGVSARSAAIRSRLWGDHPLSYWYSHIQPVRPPLDVVLHHMILAGEAVPAVGWITTGQGRGLDRARARAWWRLILDHKYARMPDINSVFFELSGPAVDPLDAAPHVWEGMSHDDVIAHCRQQRLEQAGEHLAPNTAPQQGEAV